MRFPPLQLLCKFSFCILHQSVVLSDAGLPPPSTCLKWQNCLSAVLTTHNQNRRNKSSTAKKGKEIFLLKQTKKKVGSLGCRYQAVNVWNVAEGRPTIWEKSISLQFHRNDSVLTLLLKFIEMIPTNSSQSAVRPFLLKWGDILKPACPKSFARNSEIFFPKKIEE